MPADPRGEPRGTIADLVIAANHPAYAGHFPGEPVLPGVVLLDAALHQICRSAGPGAHRWKILTAKFLKVVRPGDPLRMEHGQPDGDVVRWIIRNEAGPVASGTFGPA